ncbi:protein tyrosine phosphatase receptor type C-associated protein [Grus japonensis]|uniref:Protein tyrosine phosphatase receptor type C-associated protein n=1 Tax=Grus japonensis TaxID=30415 RepID=A0ABC9WWG8_GRUJA
MGRRVLALLRGRWYQLRGRGGLAMQPCHEGGEMVVVADLRDEEEELMPWSQDQRPQDEEEEEEEEEEENQREDDDEEEEEERDEEEEEEEEVKAKAEAAPEVGESPPSGGQVAGGSAEALLSDLHAFSGTAAWGDTRPNVTAP